MNTFYLLAQNGVSIPGVVRVKLKPEMVKSMEGLQIQNVKGAVVCGLPAIDKANATYKATTMRRVFRYSPKFEAKHQKYGLHLWYDIMYGTKATPEDMAKSYANLEGVDAAQPVYQIENLDKDGSYKRLTKEMVANLSKGHLDSKGLPFNDPLLPDQWHYINTGQNGGTAGMDINAAAAWQVTGGNPSVIVAVMDQGIDFTHEDLAANVWTNNAELKGQTGKDDDGNGYIDDVHGFNFTTNYGAVDPGTHATHVAGTITAINNNGIGVSGVAGGTGKNDGVKVMSCEILGTGAYNLIEESYIYAADNGAVISSNSWGFTGGGGAPASDPALYSAIDYFIAEAGNYQGSPMHGGVVIVAAGNDGTNTKHWPGAYDKVICVSALGARGEATVYTNFGSWVDIAAPGGSSNVTAKQGVLSLAPGNGYAYMDGTSMATPHVSGVAALVVSKFASPGFTNESLKAHLLTSFKDIYSNPLNASLKDSLGAGLIDAGLALQNNGGLPPTPITDLKIYGIAQDFADLTWSVPADQNNLKPVSFQILASQDPSFGGAVPLYSINKKDIGALDTFEITNLLPLTTYYFTVRSVDRFGNVSLNSNVINATTNAGPKTVVTPTTLTLAVNTSVNKTGTSSLAITNTGAGTLKYSVSKYHKSNTDATAIDDPVYTDLLPANGVQPISLGAVPFTPNETITPDAQTAVNPVLTKQYYNRSNGGWFIGEDDTTQVNSAAISFYVDDANGFNLTDVYVDLKVISARGPIRIEIRSGINIATSKLLMIQNYTTSTSYDGKENTYDITLNNQIFFATGSTFWVVVHVPHGQLYPLFAGKELADGQDARCFMSNNMGKSWSRLQDVFWDTNLVWGIAVTSKLVALPEFVTLSGTTGTVTSNTGTVTATVDATNLINGTYNENLQVYTNETNNPVITVPYTVTVTGQQPVIVVPENLDFGSVFKGSSKSLDLVIPNNGLGRYKTISITISDPQFKSSVTSISTIAALSSSTVTFTYTPTSFGSAFALVTLKGSNQNTPANTNIIYTFAISGAGAAPPVIAVSPLVGTFTNVAMGTIVTGSVGVTNNGTYPLKYYIPPFGSATGITTDIYTPKFGYTMQADTLNTNSSYVWNDIAASGTPIKTYFTQNSVARYYGVKLNFRFPFYGNRFDSVYLTYAGIIGLENGGSYANRGDLQFMDVGSLSMNGYLPARCIAALGQGSVAYNLSSSPNGNIYYQQFPDRIVVQYDNVYQSSAGTGTGGFVTFQIVLLDNGDIKYYYKSVPVRTDANFWKYAAIYIFDKRMGDGYDIHSPVYTKYPQYNYFTVKNIPSSGSAISLTCPGLGIISSIDKPTGTIYSGQSAVVNYTANTANLYQGTITQSMNFVSNDPVTPITQYTISLNITSGGTANLVPSATSLAFGNVMQTANKMLTLNLQNAGSKNITVTSATTDNANFNVQSFFSDLKYGRTGYVNVAINSANLGALTGVLTVVTDVAGTFTFNLSGNIVNKSAIVTDVTSITQTLASGSTYNTTVNVQNPSSAPLEFLVAGNQWIHVSQPTLPINTMSYDYLMSTNSPTFNPTGFNAPAYDWTEIIGQGALQIYDSIYNPPTTPLWYAVPIPWNFKFYGVSYDTLYINWQGMITFQKQNVFQWSGPINPSPNIAAPNNFISALSGYGFPNRSGGYPLSGLYVKIFSDKVIVENRDYQDGWGMSGNNMTFETILYNDGTIKFAYQSIASQLANTGIAAIENQDGTKGQQLSYRTTGYLFAKTAAVFVPVVNYILAPGASQPINVTLDASKLAASVNSGIIALTNNTPDQPNLNIPVSLTVTGTPAISVPAQVDFGTLMGYVTTGTTWKTYTKTFYVKNTGTANLTLTSITPTTETPNQMTASAGYVYFSAFPAGWAWSASLNNTVLAPGDSLYCRIVVTPKGTNPATTAIPAINNTVTIATSTVGLTVPTILVTANNIYKPIVSFTPKTIAVTANDTTYKSTANVTITNSQIPNAADLNYKLSLSLTRPITTSANSLSAISNKFTTDGRLPVAAYKSSISTTGIAPLDVPGYNRTLEYTTKTTKDTQLGYGGSYYLTTATAFTAPADGFNLTHVMDYYIPGDVLSSDIYIEIRAGSSAVQTSTVIYSGTYHLDTQSSDNVGSYIIIPLNNNVHIYPNETFYISIRYPNTCTYPQGVLNIANSDMVAGRYWYYYIDANAKENWVDYTSAASLANYANMTKALEKSFETPGWVSLASSASGTVASGSNFNTASVNFNAKNAVQGLNSAKLIIISNDSISSSNVVNLSLYLNKAPVFSCGSVLNLNGDENTVITQNINITDPENNTVSVAVDQMTGLTYSFDNVQNIISLSYSPTYNDAGLHTFHIKATDQYGAVSDLIVNVTVNNVNRPPVAKTIADKTLYTGGSNAVLNFADVFTDPDNDAMIYSISSDIYGSVDMAVGTTSYTFTPLTAGVTNITLTATDINNASTSTTFKVTVIANHAPVVANAIATQSLPLTVPVTTTNISLTNIFSDADNDVLIYIPTSSNTAVAKVVISGSNVVVTPVTLGATLVTVVANDGKGGSVSTTFTVNVINHAPTVSNAITDKTYYLGASGSTSNVVSFGNVFTDLDNNTLTVTAVSSDATIADVSVNSTNIVITPKAIGHTTIILTANDGKGGTVTTSFAVNIIVVSPIVNMPIADIWSYITQGTYTLSLSNIFTDLNGYPLTFSISTDNNSVVTVSYLAGVISITPQSVGNATITIAATNSKSTPVSTSFHFVVLANAAPVASTIPDQFLKLNGSNLSIDLSKYFSDANGNTLTYNYISTSAKPANISINGNILTASPIAAGNTYITIKADDGKGGATSTSFILTVGVATGINSIEANASVNVYPNPAKDIANFHITLTEASALNITVSDLTGRVLRNINQQLSNGSHTIPVNVGGLSHGIYYYRISNPNQTIRTGKLVIE